MIESIDYPQKKEKKKNRNRNFSLREYHPRIFTFTRNNLFMSKEYLKDSHKWISFCRWMNRDIYVVSETLVVVTFLMGIHNLIFPYFFFFFVFLFVSVRVHAFGVGENASRRLIQGLAEAGRGRAEFIATGERMQSKVSYFSVVMAFETKYIILRSIHST